MTDSLNTSICPLCQKSNLCDVNNTNGCWCMNAKVPQALLDKVPPELKHNACICNHCISEYNQKQK